MSEYEWKRMLGAINELLISVDPLDRPLAIDAALLVLHQTRLKCASGSLATA